MTMNLLTRESEIARLEAELATLRAQLAEAREIISGIADISPWSVVESDFLRQKAKAYLDKVTTV